MSAAVEYENSPLNSPKFAATPRAGGGVSERSNPPTLQPSNSPTLQLSNPPTSRNADGLDAYAPAIDRVLARDPVTTSAGVLQRVRDGTCQLWDAGPGSVIVTEVGTESRGVVVLIWLASGELEPLLRRERDIVAWSKRIGAVAIRITGRPGWVKVLRGLGYKETARVVELELGA